MPWCGCWRANGATCSRVGDPDQSIYAFRGADYRNVTRFREDHPDSQMIMLGQNYRSHQAILDAAVGVISKNPGRIANPLFSERKEGPLLTVYEAYNEDDEAQYIVNSILELIAQRKYTPGDFAIMYRTNAQSRALEDAFLRAGLPYRLIGATRFYSRREVKDALAYLRLIHNIDDTVSVNRIINVPPRGIGQKTAQELETWAESKNMTVGRALLTLLDGEEAPFTGRSRNVLAGFAEMLVEWGKLKETISPADLLSDVLNRTNYLAYLDDGTEEGRSRAENVLELRGVALSYEGLPLSTFLEEVVADLGCGHARTGNPGPQPAHAARGKRAGISGGVYPRTGRRRAAPHALDGRPKPDAGRAPPDVRGHHPRQGAPVPDLRLPPFALRRQQRQYAVTLPLRYSRRSARGGRPAQEGQRRLGYAKLSRHDTLGGSGYHTAPRHAPGCTP